ncbi:Uncharacterized ACR, YdiU/UPF0061 family [Andreprevotia lacus DSM 23236]|jgi:hypothetical protein|uniref:Uncharacterized ACR, YdiU/UPF0061 family n=1 Tax=Andreprevotia lacus DSM 23236 TaxID=1121001 RepID=A0A1W1XZ86_9NEIS|nr:protein adenylyltransferase SelO family protein [Andreprevotia lacus]SMC29185.1 Uncharacterized ACR, YdiU/UPF0061 family [Andreprevotia lacus DSM 23236]
MTRCLLTHPQVNKDNTALFDKELPPESFVTFGARRLSKARLVWVNHALLNDMDVDLPPAQLEAQLLDSFAYMVPGESDQEEYFTQEIRQFLAERYGGQGEASNGGGVRCGLNGQFQLKGIGRNPLAGRDMDFWHTHGGATIEEGIREAVWGEMTHQEFPYGGVRILAVIATGKETNFDFGLQGNADQISPEGAIIVRQVNIRPANYERATYFRPYPGLENAMCHDAIRTEAAVSRLVRALPVANGQEEQAGSAALIAGLQEMARRFASQHAYARARRFVHGAISTSNIDISGRYIDFGTMTALSGYGNYIIAKGFSSFWEDHKVFAGLFQVFLFFVEKYAFRPQGEAMPLTTLELFAQFQHVLKQEFECELLHGMGFPRSVIRELAAQPEHTRLFECLQQLIVSGCMNVLPLSTVPERMGDHDLAEVAVLLAASQTQDGLHEALAAAIADADLREALTAAYAAYWQQAQAAVPWTRPAYARLVEINAATRSKHTPMLYRNRLLTGTEALLQAGRSNPDGLAKAVADHVADTLNQSRRFFRELPEQYAVLGHFQPVGCEYRLLHVFDADSDTEQLLLVLPLLGASLRLGAARLALGEPDGAAISINGHSQRALALNASATARELALMLPLGGQDRQEWDIRISAGAATQRVVALVSLAAGLQTFKLEVVQ